MVAEKKIFLQMRNTILKGKVISKRKNYKL